MSEDDDETTIDPLKVHRCVRRIMRDVIGEELGLPNGTIVANKKPSEAEPDGLGVTKTAWGLILAKSIFRISNNTKYRELKYTPTQLKKLRDSTHSKAVREATSAIVTKILQTYGALPDEES